MRQSNCWYRPCRRDKSKGHLCLHGIYPDLDPEWPQFYGDFPPTVSFPRQSQDLYKRSAKAERSRDIASCHILGFVDCLPLHHDHRRCCCRRSSSRRWWLAFILILFDWPCLALVADQTWMKDRRPYRVCARSFSMDFTICSELIVPSCLETH